MRVEDTPTSCGNTQAPPTVHRKAHRKTNRRKRSDSSPSPSRRRGQEGQQVFSSDPLDLVGQTVEEVRPSQSSWLLWFRSMTTWFQCLLLLLR